MVPDIPWNFPHGALADPLPPTLRVFLVATIEKLGKDEWNTTYYPTGADASNVEKPWYIINAEGQVRAPIHSRPASAPL